jgi:hypothetical protein
VSRKHRPKSVHECKLSEAFRDYASPLTDILGDEATREEFDFVLMIAFLAWNGVILETAQGDSSHLNALRQKGLEDPTLAVCINQLIDRKRREFATDHRLIGKWEHVQVNGERRLRVEGRLLGKGKN